MCSSDLLLVVRNDLPVRSVKELVDYARANPGKLTYGSIGVGSSTHLAGEMLAMMAGLDLVHVPFKGSNQTLIEMMGGRIALSGVLSAQREEVQAAYESWFTFEAGEDDEGWVCLSGMRR